MSSAQAPVFEALIAPHRSLTRKGVRMVVAAMAVSCAAISLRFWLLGAWPVVAISFVDVPLIILLLTINLRQARASELIMLSVEEFTVIRTDPAGRRKRIALPAAWLRVDLDVERGGSRVMLSTHGRACEVGGFLHEAEKLSLFEALNEALRRVKNPRFDNPQLRDT